jgi:hypothetical protein
MIAPLGAAKDNGRLKSMAKCKQAFTRLYASTASEEPKQFQFNPGDEVKIIHAFDEVYLIRNAEGKVFNVPKAWIEE